MVGEPALVDAPQKIVPRRHSHAYHTDQLPEVTSTVSDSALYGLARLMPTGSVQLKGNRVVFVVSS
jgi:hypothetical protein